MLNDGGGNISTAREGDFDLKLSDAIRVYRFRYASIQAFATVSSLVIAMLGSLHDSYLDRLQLTAENSEGFGIVVGRLICFNDNWSPRVCQLGILNYG